MSDELLDTDGGPPLPPHLRAALFVEGLDGDPDDDARVRMAARLAGALGIAAAALLPIGLGGGGVVGGAAAAAGAGAGAAGAAGAAGVAGAATGGVLGAKAVGLAIGALVVGGAVGVTVSELRPRHTESRAVESPSPRAPSDASNGAAIDAPPIDAPDVDAPDVDAPAADAPVASKRDAAPLDLPAVDAGPSATDSIARERELIDVARSAIRAKDLRLATKQLVEHELRFPSGALAEERQVLMIEVALTKGDYDTTTKRAAEFLAAHPSSVFRRRVEDMLKTASEQR